mmetsp:Transcript_31545/g.46036  ORF Transcript_31545/g.46036 Transcript_31545/m.46036 type:complete len:600 (-) Transcript_31545:285-2084(-)
MMIAPPPQAMMVAPPHTPTPLTASDQATVQAAAAAAAVAAAAALNIHTGPPGVASPLVCAPATVTQPINPLAAPTPTRKTPRRQCRFPGCTKTIKSQGHCQKHGARAKRCKVEGCQKQAQGTHDGMCKRHWKAIHGPPPERPQENEEPPPPAPTGTSVYDTIIPASIAWKATKKRIDDREVMPLVAHLRDGGADREPGWHRAAERLSRGLHPAKAISVQFEPWERQLVMFEIMLISGTMWNSHRDLAHAWGREKGFHNVLVSQVCERRGEMERKKRSDTGRLFTKEEREAFKVKLNKARSEKKMRLGLSPEEQQAAAQAAVAAAASDDAIASPDAAAVAAATAASDHVQAQHAMQTQQAQEHLEAVQQVHHQTIVAQVQPTPMAGVVTTEESTTTADVAAAPGASMSALSTAAAVAAAAPPEAHDATAAAALYGDAIAHYSAPTQAPISPGMVPTPVPASVMDTAADHTAHTDQTVIEAVAAATVAMGETNDDETAAATAAAVAAAAVDPHNPTGVAHTHIEHAPAPATTLHHVKAENEGDTVAEMCMGPASIEEMVHDAHSANVDANGAVVLPAAAAEAVVAAVDAATKQVEIASAEV